MFTLTKPLLVRIMVKAPLDVPSTFRALSCGDTENDH